MKVRIHDVFKDIGRTKELMKNEVEISSANFNSHSLIYPFTTENIAAYFGKLDF